MAIWALVADEERFGVAIYNFHTDEPHRLKVYVGDTLHILKHHDDWYYACTSRDRSHYGIIPKTYVQIVEYTVEKMGHIDVMQIRQPQITREITSVLREWGTHWKNLYMNNSSNFEQIQKLIYDLINYRSKILSGALPVDELKDIKQWVTAKIDMGNKLLGLDMIVRDAHGNILNPDTTSTIQLYYHHKTATERIKKATSEPEIKTTKSSTYFSHAFFVSLRNFICKMQEDAELLMTLYDAKENKSFTEYYVVRWAKEGLARDLDQLHNLRVLFTDLGSRDLNRDKVFLVCYVIRVGSMGVPRETDHRRSSMSSTSREKKGLTDGIRRPLGVCAYNVTDFLNGKEECNEEKEHIVPFLHCTEKDTLDSTLKKLIYNKDFSKDEFKKGHGLIISFKLLHGDLKQVREENPHLVLGNVAIARKMGFPEIILPGDVRNDLYMTLVCGEFAKGSKTSDKNVEVTVTVCNEKGQAIQGVMFLGGGVPPLNAYHSVIYYHEDKPKWNETFKVAVPIEEFKVSHLKFTFKHRSSNETKDKNEKPFGMSYVRMMQANGTTLIDTNHELLVYKIDHKKFDPNDLEYLTLPSRRVDLQHGDPKPACSGLSLSNKDGFTIATNVCSTKLTQNVDLLGLLNWVTHQDSVEQSLKRLTHVDGDEIVKFLQDVLDALFNILMQNNDTDRYDHYVFDCLLHIIGLMSDRKYHHFQPVLDLYIKESFSATLAYSKLITVLKYHIEHADAMTVVNDSTLLRSMKSLQYIMRFIVRSRFLFTELYGVKDDNFESIFNNFLQTIIVMMCYTTNNALLVQGACLKYLPSTIPDILQIFDAVKLSEIFTTLIKRVPPNRLEKQKMMTVNDIIHSKLFLYPECRAILLPNICNLVKDLLEANQEIELCIKILSDVLDLLFRNDIGSTMQDITEIMLRVLRTVIQSMITMDRDNPLVANLVAIIIAVFRQMTAHHYEIYINNFVTRFDLLDFVMEIFMVFKDLVSSKTVFPSDWFEMIMLQNFVILKGLRFFAHITRDRFFQHFDNQVWNNFYHCAIAFLTQPALQLETFSEAKRNRIISRYKDMRREAGFEIRAMWFNLGQYKKQFVPSLIGPFLEMTLIPETELRRATIPIFFDMMQCEFYSSRLLMESFGDTKDDPSHKRGNFHELENEMIAKLDILIEGGRGDVEYKELFYDIMTELCENHSALREQGVRFVKVVARLIERLLEYRDIIHDENKENRMNCTVNLLDFYSEINRKEMYIRYVYKLCDLHLECDNYTEAAYTLKLHSNLLNWSDKLLPPLLKSHKHAQCQTHRELKETLYYSIIDYFDKGKMWEGALAICKELMKQYEDEVFEYLNLSELLKRMSNFYDAIMKQIRPKCEYFRVAYYGRAFPTFLQNRVFIYRGREFERLSDFSQRLLNQLPHAELMKTLEPPDESITETNLQFVQINSVEPVMSDKKRFSGKPVNDQILSFYHANDVQTFRFSRPFHKKEVKRESKPPAIAPDDAVKDDGNGPKAMEKEEAGNEFATLWIERTVLMTSYPLPGILRWFPVINTTVFELSPLQNAIETMETSNKQLRDLINAHKNDPTLPINPLSMKLQGIVDPAVMGGIMNYEKAFFTTTYQDAHPEDIVLVVKLKDLIASQMPLLEVGVLLHKKRAPPSLLPFQQHLEERFNIMRVSIEEKYGKKTCDIKFERSQSVIMRRHLSHASSTFDGRFSEMSINSDYLGSRLSLSLTKAQANTTLKALATTFSNLTANNSSALNGLSTKTSSTASMTSLTKKKSTKIPGKEKRRASKRLDREALTSLPFVASATQWYTAATTANTAPTEPTESTPASANTSINVSTTPGSVAPSNSPVVELREELTPHRPLRSEVEKEKRLSRPSSGNFSRPSSITSTSTLAATMVTIRNNGECSENSSNRDSVDTTSSSTSHESKECKEAELVPPPLPAKSPRHRDIIRENRKNAAVQSNVTDKSDACRDDVDYCNLPDEEKLPDSPVDDVPLSHYSPIPAGMKKKSPPKLPPKPKRKNLNVSLTGGT